MEKYGWFYFLTHLTPLWMICGYLFHMPYLFLGLFFVMVISFTVLDGFVTRDPKYSYEELLITPENDGRLSPWIYEAATGSYLILHLIAFGMALYFVQFEQPFIAWLLYAFPFGLSTGASINAAHELVHKNTKIEKTIGRFFLSLIMFNIYEYDHLYLHHKDEHTCTDEDIGTAKINQSLYSYMTFYYYMLRNSFKLQREMLNKTGHSFYNIFKNTLLRWTLFSFAFVISIYVFLGAKALCLYFCQLFIFVFLFASVTYNQHYGLNRRRRADNTLEPFTYMNIWASDHFMTGRFFINLSHHGHHHLFNLCRYPHLKVLKLGPLLPYGYNYIMALSFFPKRWYKVMNPLVEEVFRERDRLEKEGKL